MELPRTRLFTNKALSALLIPLFMEQLLGTLVGMVDGIMVSSVGEAAISVERWLFYLYILKNKEKAAYRWDGRTGPVPC